MKHQAIISKDRLITGDKQEYDALSDGPSSETSNTKR